MTFKKDTNGKTTPTAVRQRPIDGIARDPVPRVFCPPPKKSPLQSNTSWWREWRKKRAVQAEMLRMKGVRRGVDGVAISESVPPGRLVAFLIGTFGRGVLRPASFTGAFLLGVLSTGAIYQQIHASATVLPVVVSEAAAPEVAGVAAEQDNSVVSAETVVSDEDVQTLSALITDTESQERFDERVRAMVKGYPIEAMVPYILKQDRMVAAFLVSIAKKESAWGKRVPVLDGQDCFNYWGYRGIRPLMGTGGHTCFNGRQDAVTTVAKRLKTLIEQNRLNTPEKMIIWKCGSSCSGHSTESVRKWISDVDMYFSALNEPEDAPTAAKPNTK